MCVCRERQESEQRNVRRGRRACTVDWSEKSDEPVVQIRVVQRIAVERRGRRERGEERKKGEHGGLECRD